MILNFGYSSLNYFATKIDIKKDDEISIPLHPFLHRMIMIVDLLYQSVNGYRRKLRKVRKHNVLLYKYKSVKNQTKIFDKYINQNSDDNECIPYEFKNDKNEVPKVPSVFIWDLVRDSIQNNQYDHTDIFEQQHKRSMRCAGCKMQQSHWPMVKFKICKCCKLVYYCSKKCQKYDWVVYGHRDVCFDLNITFATL